MLVVQLLYPEELVQCDKEPGSVEIPTTLNLGPVMAPEFRGTHHWYSLASVLVHDSASKLSGSCFAIFRGLQGWACEVDGVLQPFSPKSLPKEQKFHLLFYTPAPVEASNTGMHPVGCSYGCDCSHSHMM